MPSTPSPPHASLTLPFSRVYARANPRKPSQTARSGWSTGTTFMRGFATNHLQTLATLGVLSATVLLPCNVQWSSIPSRGFPTMRRSSLAGGRGDLITRAPAVDGRQRPRWKSGAMEAEWRSAAVCRDPLPHGRISKARAVRLSLRFGVCQHREKRLCFRNGACGDLPVQAIDFGSRSCSAGIAKISCATLRHRRDGEGRCRQRLDTDPCLPEIPRLDAGNAHQAHSAESICRFHSMQRRQRLAERPCALGIENAKEFHTSI